MDLKKIKSKKGFTLIELMVVIVIIGILVAIALPNFISAQDRAKLSSVKANMHTMQTVAETYAVDWGGVYADNVTMLVNESSSRGYWKDFKNPFSGTSGPAKGYSTQVSSSLPDTGTGGTLTADVATFPIGGMVAYQSIDTSGSRTKYYVYGGEKESAKYLADKGVAFYLTNQ